MSAFYAGEFAVERAFGKHARTNASIFHIVVKVRVSEVRIREIECNGFREPDLNEAAARRTLRVSLPNLIGRQ
jgi:hypothetical protein